MSDEIEAWLRGQVDADERWANASASPDYSDGEEGTPGYSATVLREVVAKRRMLDDILSALTWGDEASAGEWNDYTDHAGDFLKVLASVYADRPGFREEWAA